MINVEFKKKCWFWLKKLNILYYYVLWYYLWKANWCRLYKFLLHTCESLTASCRCQGAATWWTSTGSSPKRIWSSCWWSTGSGLRPILHRRCWPQNSWLAFLRHRRPPAWWRPLRRFARICPTLNKIASSHCLSLEMPCFSHMMTCYDLYKLSPSRAIWNELKRCGYESIYFLTNL